MPIPGLKILDLKIILDDQSEEDSFEDSSEFERSDSLSPTNSENLRINTTFNSFTVANSLQKNNFTTNFKRASLTVGQQVLCRDDSCDRWRKAVVRSTRPIRLNAEGSSLKRFFSDIKTLSGSSIGYSEESLSLGSDPPTSEPIIKFKEAVQMMQTESVGGNFLTTPRNVKFTVVEFSDSQSKMNIDSDSSEPTADGLVTDARDLFSCLFE